MTETELWMIGAGACGVPLLLFIGIAIVSAFSKAGRARFAIERRFGTPIESLEVGTRSKVIGRARPLDGRLVQPPDSDRRGVAYEVDLRYTKGSEGSHDFLRDAVDFVVEDDTGRVLVRTDAVILILEHGPERMVSVDEAPAWMREINPRKYGRYGVREAVVEPGGTVAVLGTVQRTEHPDCAFELVAGDEGEVVIGDHGNAVSE